MEYFESKEEILDIQLTEYGKQRIADGNFKPTYYAFFDDDIIYDSNYGNYSEQQNDIQDRILSTARPKLQTNMAGQNTTFGEQKNVQAEADKFYFLTSPLGTGESGNDNYPAWSIKFFNDNLVRVIQRPTGSYFTFNTIPQLNATIDYRTFVNELNTSNKNLINSHVFPDDTFIDLEEDSLFIRVVEHNAPFVKENFEIEIFEVETSSGTDKLRLLEFNQTEDLDTLEQVGYFLEVNIDTDIDSKEFCEKVPQNERTLYFVDRIHDCKKIADEERIKQDIYDENESGEIC